MATNSGVIEPQQHRTSQASYKVRTKAMAMAMTEFTWCQGHINPLRKTITVHDVHSYRAQDPIN